MCRMMSLCLQTVDRLKKVSHKKNTSYMFYIIEDNYIYHCLK